jgi:hypothetical protein
MTKVGTGGNSYVQSHQQKREKKKEEGGKKKEGREHKGFLRIFGANLVSDATMICSTTGNNGWNLVIDLLTCLLARSLLVMRRTLILETQLVDF